MRRLFIMRKDLHMSTGKLLAQVSHCAEAYWTRALRQMAKPDESASLYQATLQIPKDIFEQYVCGIFTKTVCEAKSRAHLLKAKAKAYELGLIEGEQYGLIFDNCLTELTPEEPDGTTLTGIWFCPLPDDVSHEISKKYHLYV